MRTVQRLTEWKLIFHDIPDIKVGLLFFENMD
jgi:hypothetical protein